MVSDKVLVARVTGFLKQKRIEAGLTQKAVAEHFGYTSGQFVSNWERGLVMPPLATIRRLAEMYGVSLDEVYQLICNESQRAIHEQLYDSLEQEVARDQKSGSQSSVANASDRLDLEPQGSELLSNRRDMNI